MRSESGDAVELNATAVGGVRLTLRVKPGGRTDRMVGAHAGALKVEVTAAPERGKANAAVQKLLASCLRLSRSCVEITSGLTARTKTVILHDITVREVVDRLDGLGVRAIERSKV